MAPEVSVRMSPSSPSSSSSFSSSSFQPCTIPANFLASLGETDRRVAKYILEQTEEQERIAEAQSVSQMLINAVERIGVERNCGGLETSKWANKSGLGISPDRKNNDHSNHSNNYNHNHNNHNHNNTSNSTSHSSSSTNICSRRQRTTTTHPSTAEPRPQSSSINSEMASAQKWAAIVDDTDAFMNAIDSLPALGAKPSASQGAAEIVVRLPANAPASAPANIPTEIPVDIPVDTPVDALSEVPVETPKENAVEEDRENQLTFSSWGVPTARTGPAAEIRRIVLTNIPSFLLTPTKVLSLMHGGCIETVSVNTTKQTADILFCDAVACKSFYDKYPNGIDVDLNARRGTVFVEMGKEVDVVSSRLRESLGLGATRVLRAVGAPMDCTMEDMIRMTEKNLKLEKIVDTYEAGFGIRTVTFRFCTIDNAVRFRSVLVRDESWEQANVQYGPDPCEIATGIHWD